MERKFQTFGTIHLKQTVGSGLECIWRKYYISRRTSISSLILITISRKLILSSLWVLLTANSQRWLIFQGPKFNIRQSHLSHFGTILSHFSDFAALHQGRTSYGDWLSLAIWWHVKSSNRRIQKFHFPPKEIPRCFRRSPLRSGQGESIVYLKHVLRPTLKKTVGGQY